MNYHNITTDDMLNGDGLRAVLWVAGCEHHCLNCQNPETWDPDGGIEFDEAAYQELMKELNKPYISGITFSGGDPLHPNNADEVFYLAREIRERFPEKTIWLYTGYLWRQIYYKPIMEHIDILVEGPFIESLKSVDYPWAGSTNQRVIDVQESLKAGEVVLKC